MREWVLAEQNHEFLRSRKWELAVLPFGATEPHNLHMPYGTDNYEVEVIGLRACEKAYRAGAGVLLLPVLPYGVNTNYFKVPGGLACSLNPTTLLAIIRDLVDSLEQQGVPKLLLLNGHGGNELKPFLRELYPKTALFLCLCDWYRMIADVTRDIFAHPGEHADEMETSLGLAFFPDLVHMEHAADGVAQPARFEAINKGWISITRPWHLAADNTGMGNPHQANADKGRRLMDIIVDRLASFLVELAKTPLDDKFPY